MKRRMFLLMPLFLVRFPNSARADFAGNCSPSLADLRKMSICELDQLFAHGAACEPPVGVTRGHVLRMAGDPCPRLRARTASMLWKGKVFFEDATFTNRWCGFRAGKACVQKGASSLDGQPAILLIYPPDAPLFGNARDEVRAIAPGRYLGRMMEVCPELKLKAYFLLEHTDSCAR